MRKQIQKEYAALGNVRIVWHAQISKVFDCITLGPKEVTPDALLELESANKEYLDTLSAARESHVLPVLMKMNFKLSPLSDVSSLMVEYEKLVRRRKLTIVHAEEYYQSSMDLSAYIQGKTKASLANLKAHIAQFSEGEKANDQCRTFQGPFDPSTDFGKCAAATKCARTRESMFVCVKGCSGAAASTPTGVNLVITELVKEGADQTPVGGSLVNPWVPLFGTLDLTLDLTSKRGICRNPCSHRIVEASIEGTHGTRVLKFWVHLTSTDKAQVEMRECNKVGA